MPTVLNRKKCGETFPLGALFGAGASLLGSGIDSSTAYSMNQANIQMQRETNEQNYKMFHEQQDFAENMWNKANAYNSPEEIAKRLRDVGVNPLKVLSGEGSSMQTAGLQSSPSGSPMVAPQNDIQSLSRLGQGISRSVDSYFENMNKSEDIKAKKLELLYQSMTFENRLERDILEKEKLLADKNLSDKSREFIQSQIDEKREDLAVLQSVRQDRIRAYGLQNDEQLARTNLAKAQKEYNDSLVRINKVTEEYLPKQYRAQIKSIEENIIIGYMNARANGLSAEAAIDSAKAALENALKTDGIKMDDKQRNQYITKKLSVLESEYNRNERQGKTWFKQVLDAQSDFDDAMNGSYYKKDIYNVTPARPWDNPRTLRW